jgi:protease-4
MKRTFGCLTIFLLLILSVSLLLNLILLADSGKSRAVVDFEEIHIDGNALASDRIAVINLFGVISYTTPGEVYSSQIDDYIHMIRQAVEDDTIKAIIIRIDSPGGEVTASDVLYNAISEANEKKPVVAFIESIGTSGAYYAAIGSRHIIANQQSITGSIGVILQTINMQDLAQKIGVSLVTFKSGKLKDLLNPLRPVTPEETVLFQDLIDESYDRFVSLVALERKLEVESLRDGVADGRVLSGTQAEKAKLIDQTGYFKDAIAKATALGNASSDASVIQLQAPFAFARIFRLLGEQRNPTIKVQLAGSLPELLPGRLYYISGHLFSSQP